MKEIEYFFYEWLIIGKKMTEEEFKKLNEAEFEKLKIEFIEFHKNK